MKFTSYKQRFMAVTLNVKNVRQNKKGSIKNERKRKRKRVSRT